MVPYYSNRNNIIWFGRMQEKMSHKNVYIAVTYPPRNTFIANTQTTNRTINATQRLKKIVSHLLQVITALSSIQPEAPVKGFQPAASPLANHPSPNFVTKTNASALGAGHLNLAIGEHVPAAGLMLGQIVRLNNFNGRHGDRSDGRHGDRSDVDGFSRRWLVERS